MIEATRRVRQQTETFASGLSAEDQCVQSMPDASPVKWHRGHTTWFFETFVLHHALGQPLRSPEAYAVLFNSYYQGIGAQHTRGERGLLTRPALADVVAYRQQVDAALEAALAGDRAPEIQALVELGLHHEQQHQELLLTDVLHLFSRNPTAPVVGIERRAPRVSDGGWRAHDGGIVRVGHASGGFHYDNEGPAHDALLVPFALSERLVTNAEYDAFIADGGYQRPEFWTSAGWATVNAYGWRSPGYWRGSAQFGLQGLVERDPDAPVCHVSWFEADAYARFVGARLPTEFEWEAVAPAPPAVELGATPRADPHGFYGSVWQWTASPYVGYPGYQPAPGAVGEYNGKFMCDQWVLRGSSFGTSGGHARKTYRNFFPSNTRWQFTGIRLAK